jgi:short-subunit dehydrogenase
MMLTNKILLITGASSGIGEALARRATQLGAIVVIAARRKDRLDSLAAALQSDVATNQRVLPLPCDITVRAQAEAIVETTIERFGRIDVLVNNAGRGHFACIEDTDDDTIQNMFALNVYALWYTIRPTLRHMRARGNGHIINIASIAGKLGFPFNSAYVAAKHAVVGFTHALRMELAGTDIHATVVCPATVATDWALVTDGGSMLPLFEASVPITKAIARDQGVALPAIEESITPERAANQILECIHHPVPELYTNRGTYEFLLEAARDRAAAERRQIPAALAERAVFEQLRRK